MRRSLHPYRLALTAPIVLKGAEYSERRGTLLRLEAHGRVGWGDCAPLPGFSRETLEQGAEQLASLAPWLARQRPEADWGYPDHPIHDDIDEIGLQPSARFALDLALLDLSAQVAAIPLPLLLDPDAETSLPLNALLTGDDASVLERAETLVQLGYRALKVKVGRRDLQHDVALMRELRLRVGPDVAIRCDANQAWTLAEAADFAEGIFGLGVAYVEEPLKEPEDLGLLWTRAGLPLALDESLIDLEPEDLVSKAYASAVVLKPTLLGGMIRTMRFAREARLATIPPTISGAFESGVAMRGHVALAVATGAEPAGLDPYNRLASDVLRPRLPLDRPLVDVDALFSTEHEVVPP